MKVLKGMYSNNESVLITGGTGSFGKTMLQHLLKSDIGLIKIFSRDEDKQHHLRNLINDDRVQFLLGDIRDFNSISSAMRGVDYVFHAAALKQVPSCEFFPMEAIRTNVLGSENVIRASIYESVKSLVCLSTDKAVFPINAMGQSKALMEKLIQAASRQLGTDAGTTISCVRYGNVMYSRGSVIPTFINQIIQDKPITVTEPTMTRFLMPLSDSVALVDHAFKHAKQGDLFIKKAVAATVGDLVSALKELFQVPNHQVQIIGWRHSEKLYETLASAQEIESSEDMGDYLRIVLDQRDLNYRPFFTSGKLETVVHQDYHSHNAVRLDVPAIKNLLLSLPEIVDQMNMWKDDR